MERRFGRGVREERIEQLSSADRSDAEEAVLCPERWAVEALVGLWEANRVEGEAYGDCFARLGVPRYATLLDHVMNPAT